MHRLLERALPGAKGESRHVIAMVADIRGFSSFSKQNDSADVASYVSKVYLRLISEFGGVSSDAFFKTTGDGLLFVFPFEEADLEETYNKVVGNAMKCHDSFGDFAKGIRMINFETPRAIAFGISRGSACALVSSLDGARMVLDYSGHKLNLAARLQDLARPSGVILEGSPDVELLQPALREQFTSTDIYVRSVAEKNTIKVFTSKTVKLPQSAKSPPGGRWVNSDVAYSRKQFLELDTNVRIVLEAGTVVDGSLQVRVQRPHNPKKGEVDGLLSQRLVHGKHFELQYEQGRPHVVVYGNRVAAQNRSFIEKGVAKNLVTLSVIAQLL